VGWGEAGRDDRGGLKLSDCTVEGCGRDICSVIVALEVRGGVTLVCNSMAAASAVWAAATFPSGVIDGVVMLSPFAWDHPMPAAMRWLLWAALRRWAGGAGTWATYYRSLYTMAPTPVADLDAYIDALCAHLAQPGRMDVVRTQVFASKAACADRIPAFLARRIPFSVVFGGSDPDFPDVAAEAAAFQSRFTTSGPAGAGAGSGEGGAWGPREVVVLPGVGHYPHVEAAVAVAGAIGRLVGV
jgi:pimeloyl-ACP methyl ester carboxylesterase